MAAAGGVDGSRAVGEALANAADGDLMATCCRWPERAESPRKYAAFNAERKRMVNYYHGTDEVAVIHDCNNTTTAAAAK